MDPLVDFTIHALQVMPILIIATPISPSIYIPLAIGGIASLMPQERTINTTNIERLEGVIQLKL